MKTCQSIYEATLTVSSDIVEHLPILYRLAQGRRVLELGVHNGNSTSAFLAAGPSLLVSVDHARFDHDPDLPECSRREGIRWNRVKTDSREARGDFDLTFFDTWHTADQVREELAVHALHTSTYLVFHDVASCGEKGEDGGAGILLPIRDLLSGGQWVVDRLYLNNNGLLVLRRKYVRKLSLVTEYPLALTSADHIIPFGAVMDDTHCPDFVKRCVDLFGEEVSLMDLGCSGGGLVEDFLRFGYFAVGLEGCDLPQKTRRAAWGRVPNNLFTCDITKPFICCDYGPFHVVSAWGVLEHIAENDLLPVMQNVHRHLSPQGLFCSLIGTTRDEPYHQTVKDSAWWMAWANGLKGLFSVEDPYQLFPVETMPRGSGNGKFDRDVRDDPSWGLHLVMRRTA